jgi:hypothetical protein
MCGIVGCAGKSSNPNLSYQLLTNLLVCSQVRGKHATGFYLIDQDGHDHSFKSPIPASIFTTLNEWKEVLEFNPKAIVMHTRFKTRGSETDNTNNHPHISKTKNVALVHNGNLYTSQQYRKEYHLNGETDSEMILKMVLKANNITTGIKNVFEIFGKSGDFACELIYRNPETLKTTFYFFRDSGRPGKVIDLKDQLGQYFFCSTSGIWRRAYEMLTEEQKAELKYILPKTIPSFRIWKVSVDSLKIEKMHLDEPSKRKTKPKNNSFGVLYQVPQSFFQKGKRIYKYETEQKEYDDKLSHQPGVKHCL